MIGGGVTAGDRRPGTGGDGRTGHGIDSGHDHGTSTVSGRGESVAWARSDGDDWLISVRVQPSGGRSRIVGVHGDSLKVRVSAPANEGKANAELIRFITGVIGVRRSAVDIVSGHRGRDKVIRVTGDIGVLIDTVSSVSDEG